MNRFNPNKLLHSKWTARNPRGRERHFMVTGLVRDEADNVIGCDLEAVINRKTYRFEWRQLRDDSVWLMGWE